MIKVALTRPFRETVQARAAGDPAFRDALLAEGVELPDVRAIRKESVAAIASEPFTDVTDQPFSVNLSCWRALTVMPDSPASFFQQATRDGYNGLLRLGSQ